MNVSEGDLDDYNLLCVILFIYFLLMARKLWTDEKHARKIQRSSRRAAFPRNFAHANVCRFPVIAPC